MIFLKVGIRRNPKLIAPCTGWQSMERKKATLDRGHMFVEQDSMLGMGVQATDILAWEWNKDFINERNGKPRKKESRSIVYLARARSSPSG